MDKLKSQEEEWEHCSRQARGVNFHFETIRNVQVFGTYIQCKQHTATVWMYIFFIIIFIQSVCTVFRDLSIIIIMNLDHNDNYYSTPIERRFFQIGTIVIVYNKKITPKCISLTSRFACDCTAFVDQYCDQKQIDGSVAVSVVINAGIVFDLFTRHVYLADAFIVAAIALNLICTHGYLNLSNLFSS